LHAIDTDRDAVDERKRFRVLRQYGRKHSRNNVSKSPGNSKRTATSLRWRQ
jgi:hypothetical protein